MTARGDPPPADLTPSGQRGSRLRRCTPCPLASLRSWRLPGLLFLYGTLDDHDRLGTRRSSSARKCSSRRASHRAPRTEGWRKATPQTDPTARRSAPPPAPQGRAVQGDRSWMGRNNRPDRIEPSETLVIEGVAPPGHRLPRGARCDSTVRSAHPCRRRPASSEPVAAVRGPIQEEEIRQTPRPRGSVVYRSRVPAGSLDTRKADLLHSEQKPAPHSPPIPRPPQICTTFSGS